MATATAVSIPRLAAAQQGLRAWQAALLVFTASCATLVLELVAVRLLAPFIGVSLYTWTSIIGVVLAGISLGSDRLPCRRASSPG